MIYAETRQRRTTGGQAGPRNLITDVPGILVGQAEDRAGVTGTTVVLAEAPAVASVDVRGGAPGSRETELLCRRRAGRPDRCDGAVGRIGFWARRRGRGHGVACRGRARFRGRIDVRRRDPGADRSGRDPVRPRFSRPADVERGAALSRARPQRGRPRPPGLRARAMPGPGSAPAPEASKAGSAAPRWCWRVGRRSAPIVAVNSWGSAVRPDCGRFWAAELALARRDRAAAGHSRDAA